MSLIDQLSSESAWKRFREYKSLHSLMSIREFEVLDTFIAEKRYLNVTDDMVFSYPKKKLINKSGSQKKRVIYTYEEDESWVLKLLSFLMFRYDHLFEDSLYSFRRRRTVKKAIRSLTSIRNLREKYVLKLDVHDYFNSIPVDRLCEEFERYITDDDRLLEFLKYLFTQNKCYFNGELITEERGAMAGMPLSAFCANIYLSDMDRHFSGMNVPYYRYSDDILLVADTYEEIVEHFGYIKDHLNKKGLTINEEKTFIYEPHESFDFLGFKYDDGLIDLSDATVKKMKDKIARKSRSLYRWRIKKGASYEKAATVLIRKMNDKYYDFEGDNEFTWSRWFFPVLTTDKGLKVLDSYLLEYVRYLYSGRHYKGNYKVTYDDIKKMGYHSLINEYYRFRNDKRSGGTP
ncbi:MAG: group II intron reverse transcriptase domain-containing protein [Erysipelotrichaceae bacterium]|nr:group II intron reverse transcriptase domain-containing protein [Erysipelotrichaceae bacterium]